MTNKMNAPKARNKEERNLITRIYVIIKTNGQLTCSCINEPARIVLYLADEVFYPPDPRRERNLKLKSAALESAGRTKGIVIPASVSSRILSPRKEPDHGKRERRRKERWKRWRRNGRMKRDEGTACRTEKSGAESFWMVSLLSGSRMRLGRTFHLA